MNTINPIKYPEKIVESIQQDVWEKANRLLLRKILCEFAHELLIVPKIERRDGNWNIYSVYSDDATIVYKFRAQQMALHHLYIESSSIIKLKSDTVLPLNAMLFIKEFRSIIGISDEILPLYLEEITSTLYSKSYMLAHEPFPSSALALKDYQTIEHAMTEGHPCFIANSGRIGFSSLDYKQFSPEANHPIQLIWLAGHKSRATFSGTKEMDYDVLLKQEVAIDSIINFNSILEKKGLHIADYYYFPVHPWQWYNKLSLVFAPDIAENYLVYLGYGTDQYLAQQSIRTFFNISHPEKLYVKTALSILNMGFMRGLSPYYMESTPAITQWISDLVKQDAYLQEKGFTLLDEVATLGYRNRLYEDLGKNTSYTKMLATLWRESPIPKLEKDQRIMTMAALLHVDRAGEALLSSLIKDSRLSTAQWIERYLDAYLSPLLHCFYHYEMIFMPHGENLILIMENSVPVKVIMKDITEEIIVFGRKTSIPEKAKRIFVEVPENLKMLYLMNDVFNFFFRFLSQILFQHHDFQESKFWKLVADCIHVYQAQHPYLSDEFKKYDLFVAEFDCCCLNRLQLKNNKQMLDLADPVGSLQFVGKLKNPIVQYK